MHIEYMFIVQHYFIVQGDGSAPWMRASTGILGWLRPPYRSIRPWR